VVAKKLYHQMVTLQSATCSLQNKSDYKLM